jgi:hypothetical protein
MGFRKGLGLRLSVCPPPTKEGMYYSTILERDRPKLPPTYTLEELRRIQPSLVKWKEFKGRQPSLFTGIKKELRRKFPLTLKPGLTLVEHWERGQGWRDVVSYLRFGDKDTPLAVCVSKAYILTPKEWVFPPPPQPVKRWQPWGIARPLTLYECMLESASQGIGKLYTIWTQKAEDVACEVPLHETYYPHPGEKLAPFRLHFEISEYPNCYSYRIRKYFFSPDEGRYLPTGTMLAWKKEETPRAMEFLSLLFSRAKEMLDAKRNWLKTKEGVAVPPMEDWYVNHKAFTDSERELGHSAQTYKNTNLIHFENNHLPSQGSVGEDVNTDEY